MDRLIYLVVTHPDLAYLEHWDVTIRIVRYLKGVPGQGIFLYTDSELSLKGWCDLDWVACPITR
ncbi:ABC transporter C family member 3-like [Gossypium australe]|uniref:ABC transporter C family member 3-like n=1 Tax=Gossypium australe TaxID=47621 RepID=A0A5B6WTZ8_9ROSI|nr:ABC transporter C family member 3-like [Gossypium australe]